MPEKNSKKKEFKGENIILKISKDDKKFIAAHAAAAGVNLSEFIRQYTLNYLKKPVTVHLSEASLSTLIGYAGFFNVKVEDLLIVGSMKAIEYCYELEKVPAQMIEKIEEAKAIDRSLENTTAEELRERYPDMEEEFNKTERGKGETILTSYNK